MKNPYLKEKTSEYESILDEAKDITSNNRQADYGKPAHNFADIARLWNAYLENKDLMNKTILMEGAGKDVNLKITTKDVSMMMILLKMAREQRNHKRDNLVDMAGYVRNSAMIEGVE